MCPSPVYFLFVFSFLVADSFFICKISFFFSLSTCLLRGHRSYAMRGYLWLTLIVKNNLLSGHASLLSAECFVSKIYLEFSGKLTFTLDVISGNLKRGL